MPITNRQRESRRKYVGSSDVAALFGLDRYKTAYDVWLDKTGQLDVGNGAAGEAADAGNLFEDGVLTWATRELGKITRNQYRSRPDLHIASHIDAIVDQTHRPVEGKTGGLFGPLHENWGEPGTDDVPNRVIIQCHVHMICAGVDANQELRLCHVPTFLGGRGFGMFHVHENRELCQLIAEKAVEFWEKCVQPVEPPTNVFASLDVIKRILRTPQKIVDVEPKILQRYLYAQGAVRGEKELLEEAKRELLTALGDAERGEGGDAGTVTYYKQTRRGLDATALCTEQPRIAEQYATTTEYRVLRTQKPKG